MHIEGTLGGTEANVPQVKTILAVESVPGYGTLAGKLQEYPAKVECGHLKEQLMTSLQTCVDEVSGRMHWLNAVDVVFLLVRVRMKGTWQVMWFMLSIGGMA